MTTETYATPASRPFGITILGILQLLAGLFGLCIPSLLLVGGSAASLLGLPVVGVPVLVIALLMYIAPLLHFFVAYGAFNLRPWAWWLGFLAVGLDVLGVVLNLWNGGGAVAAAGPALFSILVFIYLLTPGVRRAFRV